MADKTGIEWTDATWNPTVGCSIISPGCTNCYAMKQAADLERRFGSAKYAGLTKPSKAGPVWTGAVRLVEAALDQPLRWRRPRRIFVNSMSDLFHEILPDEAIARVFAVMALCPQHTFQVLTKRPERMRAWFEKPGPVHEASADMVMYFITERRGCADFNLLKWPLPNVHLGVSAEDQARADERIPILLDTPAAVRFVSCEPLLGPVDLTQVVTGDRDSFDGPSTINALTGSEWWAKAGATKQTNARLDWIIGGGESGPGARMMDEAWARSLRDQCASAGVAFFMKQMTKKAPIPTDLLVREFPDAR